MMIHPDMMLAIANQHHRELIAEGEQARLLRSARVSRWSRKGRAVRGQPTGTLASCESSAAVPAR
jgi:hypothetical protein